MLQIANPIYDVFFKYMMQDVRAAKCLLSAILDREIEVLEVLPQETTSMVQVAAGALSVMRFDYRATVRESDGQLKKILIEAQKLQDSLALGRFRRYLGSNYSRSDLVDGKDLHLPITTIYLLGFKLHFQAPVIQFGGKYINSITKSVIDNTDAFIEALTHNAYFVQIPRLPQKRQTRIERVLAVFSHEFAINKDKKTLVVPDDLKNEDNSPLVERLASAVLDPEMQRLAIEEESLNAVLERRFVQLKKEGLEEGEKIGMEKGEKRSRISSARAMLRKGIALDVISEVMGLTRQEIKQLGESD